MEEQSTVTNGPEALYIMDRAGDHFLAGAGLAEQQRGPAAPAKFLNQTENLTRAGRLPHQNMTVSSLGCADMFVPGRSNVGLIYGAFAKDKLYG